MDSRLNKDLEEVGLDVMNPLPEETAPPPARFALSPINRRRWSCPHNSESAISRAISMV